MELFTHTVACHAQSLCDFHDWGPSHKPRCEKGIRDYKWVRETERAGKRKAWAGCLFSAQHVSPALFHTVDPQPFLSPHSAPHHPISVHLHKDSYCPTGDRPLTCSICTALLVISEGQANSTARRSAVVWEGWWGTVRMENQERSREWTVDELCEE